VDKQRPHCAVRTLLCRGRSARSDRLSLVRSGGALFFFGHSHLWVDPALLRRTVGPVELGAAAYTTRDFSGQTESQMWQKIEKNSS